MTKESKITTAQAEALIAQENQTWFCNFFGIVHHTLYKRIVKHNWKKAEIIAIGHVYEMKITKGEDYGKQGI